MSESTAKGETAFVLLQAAIAKGIQPSISECWSDFAHWEVARNYADDPSHPAKAAIEWIDLVEELRLGLEDFEGTALDDCHAALDQALIAFAKLEHSDELVHAIKCWIQYRLEQ